MIRCFFQLWLGVSLLLVASFIPAGATAQIVDNGDFENGTSGWFPWGNCRIQSVEVESDQSCQVTKRRQFWNGVAQDLTGRLEVGKDYFVEARVRPRRADSGNLRFELKQTDDRGDRFRIVGEAFAREGQWTTLRAGFTLDAIGPVSDLVLIIGGNDPDQPAFDFLVDSVSIQENDWRDAADERIEQFRKRDVQLNFQLLDGTAAGPLTVEARQVRSRFRFGTAFSESDDPNYLQFIKDHFDSATVEWRLQWQPVEEVRGTLNWDLADRIIEFCEQNGITVKGHALVWPEERFRPLWLDDLSDAELMAELERRLVAALGRYEGRIDSWDVINEMLNWTYFEERLGSSVRPWIFARAKELAPEVTMLTNEFGLTVSEAKSIRYRELIESIESAGGIVDGIGLQSHFEGSFSPKGLEIALSNLEGLGKDFWFTEFDVVNPHMEQRAKSLEDFYRFAFSQPRARGINMWGFWAGTHWQGPDASLVDLDWTINAAGQKYFELIDQWTTHHSEASVAESGSLEFRGFQGDYLVTTIDAEGIRNFHLVPDIPGSDLQVANLVLSEVHDSLTVYGTPGDDLFEFELGQNNLVRINGRPLRFELPAGAVIRFLGLEGNDRLVCEAKNNVKNVWMYSSSLRYGEQREAIHFDSIETVESIATLASSSANLFDSKEDDQFDVFFEQAILQSPETTLIASGFRYVFGRAQNGGQDTAIFRDTDLNDRLVTNLDLTLLRSGVNSSRSRGFEIVRVESNVGNDVHRIDLPAGSIESAVFNGDTWTVSTGQTLLESIGASRSKIYGTDEHTDAVEIIGTTATEVLTLEGNNGIYRGGNGCLSFLTSIEHVTANEGANDYLRIFDTQENDVLRISGSTIDFTGDSFSHRIQSFDRVRAVSQRGGSDQATVTDAEATVSLIGGW